MGDTIDIEHLRQWIGREDAAEDVLTPALAARFHATIALPGEPPRAGEAAPRLIHFCLCVPAAPMAALGEDGHPTRGGFLPPIPLPRRMWAGSDITFHGDLHVSDAIRRTSRIADVMVKHGRTGTLCFVTVDHRIEGTAGGAIEDRQTIVYREASSGASAAAPTPAAPDGATIVDVDAAPTLLFRYSALTFNTHRIHYDRPYATGVEGYPALVVHGPLQATLLLHLAARMQGRAPDRFTFSSGAPLFDDRPVRLHAAAPDGTSLALWTSHAGGAHAMRATATWGKAGEG